MVKVSVLIPFYNSEAFLKPCIDSVLRQTFTDFELILLNDGSTDGSERIVKEYDDPRIRYYSNGKNLGIPVSHNKLMDYARGEYLALVDSDNLCCPDRLEKQVKYLDEHPDVTIVGSWGKLFNHMPAKSLFAKVCHQHGLGLVPAGGRDDGRNAPRQHLHAFFNDDQTPGFSGQKHSL